MRVRAATATLILALLILVVSALLWPSAAERHADEALAAGRTEVSG